MTSPSRCPSESASTLNCRWKPRTNCRCWRRNALPHRPRIQTTPFDTRSSKTGGYCALFIDCCVNCSPPKMGLLVYYAVLESSVVLIRERSFGRVPGLVESVFQFNERFDLPPVAQWTRRWYSSSPRRPDSCASVWKASSSSATTRSCSSTAWRGSVTRPTRTPAAPRAASRGRGASETPLTLRTCTVSPKAPSLARSRSSGEALGRVKSLKFRNPVSRSCSYPALFPNVFQTFYCWQRVQRKGFNRGRAGEGAGGLLSPHLGNSVHTFDFLYERTHPRRRNAHKNVTLSKFLMHIQPFKGLKFKTFPREHAPGPS